MLHGCHDLCRCLVFVVIISSTSNIRVIVVVMLDVDRRQMDGKTGDCDTQLYIVFCIAFCTMYFKHLKIKICSCTLEVSWRFYLLPCRRLR